MSTRRSHRGFHLLERLQRQRDSHRQRSRVVRSGFVVGAVFVIVTGLFMLVLPGPGILTMAVGFYLLALEFDWAERLLRWALHRADRATTQTPLVKDVARFVKRRPKTAAAILAILLTLAAIAIVSFWNPRIIPGL